MKLTNPGTTITGIIQLIITAIASIKPDLLGIDWSNMETQQQILSAGGALVNGAIGIYLIIRARDGSKRIKENI